MVATTVGVLVLVNCLLQNPPFFLSMQPESVDLLSEYVVPQAVEPIAQWQKQYGFQMIITKNRKTKLGYYKPSTGKQHPRISINATNNPHLFLLVFLHELAHLLVDKKYINRKQPHGKEWKKEYSKLLNEALQINLFPPELFNAIQHHCQCPKSSITYEKQFFQLIDSFTQYGDNKLYIEQLPENAVFELDNGLTFRKGSKRRKRYACYCLNNRKLYLFSPLARVKPS